MPAYDIGNLRFGVRADHWEVALFVNNVATKTRSSARPERGASRVGYLVTSRAPTASCSDGIGHEEPAPAAAAPPPPPRRRHRRRRRRHVGRLGGRRDG
jgi:hypothetical protein